MAGYLVHRVVECIDSSIPRPIKHALKKSFPAFIERFYRALRENTRDEIVQVTIRQGPLAGRPFRCSLRDERFYWTGTWEPAVQSVADALLQPGMVVYDAGVHKGYFSLLAAHCIGPTGRVIGFEPHSSNRRMAQDNVQLNPDLAARISICECAVSDHTGMEAFAEHKPGSAIAALNRVAAKPLGASHEVPCVALDDFVSQGNPPPDFIKMDIEGGERFAFQGMATALNRFRPAFIVEIHDQESWLAFTRLLHDCNYLSRRLTENSFSQQPPWSGRDQYLAVASECACCNSDHHLLAQRER